MVRWEVRAALAAGARLVAGGPEATGDEGCVCAAEHLRGTACHFRHREGSAGKSVDISAGLSTVNRSANYVLVHDDVW